MFSIFANCEVKQLNYSKYQMPHKSKNQKKAIIVGATSGIGRELAISLISKNYLVGITGRRAENLNEISKQYPESIFTSTFDITETQTIIPSLDDLVRKLGGLDLLILSSGYGDLNGDLNSKIEIDTIETNVKGFTSISIWAYTFFKNQNHGHFAAITSIAGLRGGRAAPAYNASKAYQINYLEGLRQKANKESGQIYVTDIRPGFVDTAMAKADKKIWMASTLKASNQILNAIEQKKTVVYVSKRWALIAFLLKILPRWLYKKM
ncbi:MAG: short-chain dehydrogenase/reductase [Daejeonella sp.]|nr:short-chain dehydrogenase/reductase [Daejeonella sp.]